MTNGEKAAFVELLTGETNTALIDLYLKMAGQKICRAAYPLDASVTEVPEQYDMIHVDAAVYLLNKRGAEGETSHSENGISRSYENADLPDSILRYITPVCGVVS